MKLPSTLLFLAVSLVVSTALVPACSKPEKQEEAEAREREEAGARVLAQIDGEPIRVASFEAAVTELPPFLREALQGEAAYLRFFGDQIGFVLLAQEAERRGLRADVAVQLETRRALVTALEAKTLEQVQAPTPSPEALAARKASAPSTPKQVVIELLAQRDPERAKRLRLAYLLARGASLAHPKGDPVELFRGFARSLSFESGVDSTLGPLGEADAGVLAPGALVAAALADDTLGRVVGPIVTDEGVYLLMRREILPARPLSDEELRGMLTREALEAEQQRALAQLRDDVLRAAAVEIVDPSLRP